MRTALPVALVAICLAGEAHADALQDKVLAAARATAREGFAFHRTTTSEQTGSAARTLIESYDPRRRDGERWTLVSVDGRAPTPKEIEQSRKAKRGPTPSYANVAQWFGSPATRSDGPDGTVIYRFARLPDGVLQVGSHDASPDTQVEAVVNTRGAAPFVERIRMVSAKKFRIMLVAAVEGLVAVARYRQLPDGQVVPHETLMDLTGSMLGKAGKIHSAANFADVQRVN